MNVIKLIVPFALGFADGFYSPYELSMEANWKDERKREAYDRGSNLSQYLVQKYHIVMMKWEARKNN